MLKLKLNNIWFSFPLKRLNASKIVSKIEVFDGLFVDPSLLNQTVNVSARTFKILGKRMFWHFEWNRKIFIFLI